MSLPDDVILLLRDEAYLDLCRTALSEANERLVAEKDQVAQTRPPFGLLATKKQKEAFEASMQNLLNNKAGIAARLGKLDAIEKWLKNAIHDRLREYLRQASENYRRSAKIAESIKAWDRLIEHYGEQLLALARNIKNVAVSFLGAAGGTRSAFSDRAQAFAELRKDRRVDQGLGQADRALWRATARPGSQHQERRRVLPRRGRRHPLRVLGPRPGFCGAAHGRGQPGPDRLAARLPVTDHGDVRRQLTLQGRAAGRASHQGGRGLGRRAGAEARPGSASLRPGNGVGRARGRREEAERFPCERDRRARDHRENRGQGA